jgi:hypothetical protein
MGSLRNLSGQLVRENVSVAGQTKVAVISLFLSKTSAFAEFSLFNSLNQIILEL